MFFQSSLTTNSVANILRRTRYGFQVQFNSELGSKGATSHTLYVSSQFEEQTRQRGRALHRTRYVSQIMRYIAHVRFSSQV